MKGLLHRYVMGSSTSPSLFLTTPCLLGCETNSSGSWDLAQVRAASETQHSRCRVGEISYEGVGQSMFNVQSTFNVQPRFPAAISAVIFNVRFPSRHFFVFRSICVS